MYKGTPAICSRPRVLNNGKLTQHMLVKMARIADLLLDWNACLILFTIEHAVETGVRQKLV